MILYPAIDIKDGKCVRLRQGRFDDVTVYGQDPLEMAKKWEACGCDFIHLVDLDGAMDGVSQNREVVLKIAQTVQVPVQIGGGIRGMETVRDYLENGVARVILGTAAVKDAAFVKEAVGAYRNKIAVGIDAKDGFVAIDGWETVSSKTAISLAQEMQGIGIRTIIYTDIATDGMLQGPNIMAMQEMVKAVSCEMIASGGVSSLEDLIALSQTGVSGAIIGKALYTGRVDLKEALQYFKGVN